MTKPARVEVNVRPAEPADVAAAVAMFAEVAAEGVWLGTEGGFDVEERARLWTETIDAPNQTTLLVVCPSGEIVGSGSVELASYGVANIGMALAAGWRGQGIGGRLLDEQIRVARELAAHKVALGVWPHNARAIRLYQSRGFVEEGRLVRHYRRSSGELWDAIAMGLVLDTTSPGSPHGDEPLLTCARN